MGVHDFKDMPQRAANGSGRGYADLYRLAIDIFIRHSLTCAQTLKTHILELVEQRSQSFDGCVAAVNKWVNILNCLSIQCGADGLAATDRAEQYVMWVLTVRRKGCVTAWDNELNPNWRAAIGYMNLRHHRCDPHGALVSDLWAFVAAGYDHVVRVSGGLLLEIQKPTRDKDCRPWVGKLNLLRNKTSDSIYAARAVQYCQLCIACSHIEELYESHAQFFGPSGEAVKAVMQSKVSAMGGCMPILESAAACEQEAESCADAALKGLWLLAVAHMDRAVQLRESEPEDAHRPTVSATAPSSVLHRNAKILAEVCTALTPIVRDLQALRRPNGISALPQGLLSEMERQFQDIIARIQAAPFVSAAETAVISCAMNASASIRGDIMRLAGRIGPEVKASAARLQCFQRCRAEGGKVDASLSSVHSLLAECWRQAAQHMECVHRGHPKGAGASLTDVQEYTNHHAACSLAYEQLAGSWLSTAADYLRKAALTRTKQAAALWREAAERTEEAARHRVAQLTAENPIERTSQEWHNWEEYAGLPCVTVCAQAAACCEEASSLEEEGIRGARRRLQCLLQSVAFERALAGYIRADSAARARDDYLIHIFRKFLADVVLAVSAADAAQPPWLPVFPEGHLHYSAVPCPTEQPEGNDLIDWLCAMSEQYLEVCVILLENQLRKKGAPDRRATH